MELTRPNAPLTVNALLTITAEELEPVLVEANEQLLNDIFVSAEFKPISERLAELSQLVALIEAHAAGGSASTFNLAAGQPELDPEVS